MIKLYTITNDPILAEAAVAAGVDRIFVDLEVLGKQARQGHLDTLISSHTMNDVTRIRNVIGQHDLLVRLNPYHKGSMEEINGAIAAGADFLMLPMFTDKNQVESFCKIVDGRVGVIPLVETPEAVNITADIVAISGVSEMYIGLNDLHLGLGLDFMFEPLANGLLSTIVEPIKSASMAFGFGGIGQMGKGLLPAELILNEHIRQGSSSVILSRTFFEGLENVDAIGGKVAKLRDVEEKLRAQTPSECERGHHELVEIIAHIVGLKNNEKVV